MGYRWRGFEHPELYDMINSGPGSAASEPQTAYWTSLTDELSRVDEALNTKLTNLGASWEGQAAESAQSGLTPLAAWAGDAETGSTVMRISSENQAGYISDARNKMPEPVSVTTPAPSAWDKVAAGAAVLTGNPGPAIQVASQAADHEAQEATQSEAQQRAVETMQTYESSSTWNRDTLGTFVAPPDVVVSTPPPQGGTTGHVQPTNSHVTTVGHGSTQTTTTHGYTVPTGGGSGGGSLTPTGGGTHVPAGQLPTGGQVSAPPAITTPSGVLPPGTPLGGPPGQPGPGINQPFNPNNPGWSNNTLLPTFNNGGNPNLPNGGNRGPLTGGPNGPGNAGDIARKGVPLRGGLPGSGGLGGAGAIEPDGSRAASQLGRGGMAGVPGENGVVRSGPGAAGAAGGRGGSSGAMGGGGRRAEGEDDDEHFAPDYLLETDDVFGDERRVAPTVIGESTPQQ